MKSLSWPVSCQREGRYNEEGGEMLGSDWVNYLMLLSFADNKIWSSDLMGEIANVNHGPLSLISPLSAARFFEHHTFLMWSPKKTTIPTQNTSRSFEDWVISFECTYFVAIFWSSLNNNPVCKLRFFNVIIFKVMKKQLLLGILSLSRKIQSVLTKDFSEQEGFFCPGFFPWDSKRKRVGSPFPLCYMEQKIPDMCPLSRCWGYTTNLCLLYLCRI